MLSFNIVTDKNFHPLAMTQQKAHAIWPLQAGTPAHGVTMEIDEALAEGISRLLERLGWFGLVNLQFIVPEDGIPKLIDFNGRPYQTLALALGTGGYLGAYRHQQELHASKACARYYDFQREFMTIRAKHIIW